MGEYVTLSLETHLFFGRVMKEHSLFLMAGFPCKNREYIEKADWYRRQFEELLEQVVEISDGIVGRAVLESGEVVTEYTKNAEECTSCLTGIPIDSRITEAAEHLVPSPDCPESRRMTENNNQRNMPGRNVPNYRRNCRNSQMHTARQRMSLQVRQINVRALELIQGLIGFKEKVLNDMTECRIYTTNYPLLLRHIIREAKLYQEIIRELNEKGCIRSRNLQMMERFWNQIMMEHALFIRGLLDPSEEELIQTADGFSKDYRRLLEEAREKDCRTMDALTQRTLRETIQYRDFKEAGTKGITECKIESLILPLLADHVLREANHYLRILSAGCREQEV